MFEKTKINEKEAEDSPFLKYKGGRRLALHPAALDLNSQAHHLSFFQFVLLILE